MTRLFWLGFGLAAGAVFARRTTRVANRLTGKALGTDLSDGLREVGAGLGAFGAEIRAGMADREHELNEMVVRRTGAPLPAASSSLVSGVPAADSPRGRRARRAGD